ASDFKGEVPDTAGQRGEGRPPQNDPRQHPARPEAVAPVAGDDLEDPVGEHERPTDQAPLRVAEVEIPFHPGASLADADAIHVQNEGKGAEITHHSVADTGWVTLGNPHQVLQAGEATDGRAKGTT